ncbi:type II secretion system F family protein [Sinirhodobacter sp. WL0062]|uniref:Type II secretion system F family protein n=1 Tax=Rhodobacter flavimaris TaxID=2907145 RepID=A0ABS8YQ56_9RHOB|nr:type II secretion system F family protein [Sinirhodobacter sp. WL0062]MCE5972031.1 type II secretion system F family protein [Sinirhodobacter sp. WL0062]
MLEQIEKLAVRYDIPPQVLIAVGIALGVLLIVWGVYAIFLQDDHVAERLAAISGGRHQDRLDMGLLKSADRGPKGLMQAFIPSDSDKRGELQRRLDQGGVASPNALRNFIMARVVLAVMLPGALILLIVASKTPGVFLPFGLTQAVASMTTISVYKYLTILLLAGYFAPNYWLNYRVSARQRKIEEGFPNALDLLQISIEAGMGFDAAMTRVGNELAHSTPEIAYEFLTVQRQVQAGRARDEAMSDMANRTGIDSVRSFANVVSQSIQFGTSMAQALTTYSEDLRLQRELRAQEMANKLPVKMSAVMASLMLPALIMLSVGPVVIRYMRSF